MKPPLSPEYLPFESVDEVTPDRAREAVDYLRVMGPSLQILFGYNYPRAAIVGDNNWSYNQVSVGVGSCISEENQRIMNRVGQLAGKDNRRTTVAA